MAATSVLLVLHLLARLVLEILDPSWTLRIFDVGQEMSIPTWFSQMLLVAGAAVALLIAHVERGRNGFYWLLIALFMTYASIDEGSAIHELFIDPVKSRIDTSGGILHFAWVIPFSALVLLIVAVLFKFWLDLPSATKRWTAIAAVTYVSGAMVLEMAGAPLASDDRIEGLTYFFIMTMEEALEMLGASLFIYALVNHLQLLLGDSPMKVYLRR